MSRMSKSGRQHPQPPRRSVPGSIKNPSQIDSRPPNRGGSSYIVWDPSWGTGTGFSYYVLGHEIGHHVCGHTIAGYTKSPHERELEADRFAGESVRRDHNGRLG